MLRCHRSTFRAFLLAAFALFGANCFAATSVPFVGVGTGTMFRTLGLAAYSTATCGTNSWTQKGGANGVDNRPGAPSIEGVVWVIWATDGSGNITTICAYLEVDSVQAVRLYLAQPTGTLCLDSQDVGAAGNDLLPNITDTVLTQAAYNAINCQPFNAALSELRAEDAKFDTDEWLVPPPKGYGPGPIGMPVQGGGSSPIVDFAISGQDPITGQQAKIFAESDVGATPLVVFANTTDAAPGHLGSAAFSNVDRFVLSGVLNGTLSRTRDLWPSSGLPCIGPQVFLPSPVSGPWTIMEYDVVDSKEVGSTQELGVKIPEDNPLNMPEGPCAGSRRRAVSVGSTLKEVGLVTDALSYLPWYTSLFDSFTTLTKYVKVDDVDPLFANYSNGTFPVCSLPCPGLVTFNNVMDGGYPLWNIIRAVTANPEPAFVASLVSGAEAQTSNYPDYVPSNSLLVFRSHYKEYVAPHNGYCNNIQTGGDVGGAVLTIQSDEDYCTDTGLELTGLRQ